MAIALSGAAGQELPFNVQQIGWTPRPLEMLKKAYSAARESEVLYCVESWTTHPASNGVQEITITAVRRAYEGSKHALADVEQHCAGPDGRELPMIHTHSDGNCQFSPRDLITAAARRAAFEGVQCGPRHFIWTTASQIVTLANASMARNPRPSSPEP